MSQEAFPFNVERIGAVGAIIHGLDLSTRLSETQFEGLRRALATYDVLFFRDQALDADQHIDLARRFGELTLYPIERFFGSVEPGCQVIVDDAENAPGVDLWHTDVTWIERPPAVAFLTCLEVPEFGGDTMWTSTAAAYEALSPVMRGMIDGLETVHSCHETFVEIAERKSGIEGLGEKLKQAYPAIRHPLVRTHPESGKRSLFITDRGVMHRIDGMADAESDALLDFIAAHVDQPRFQVRWKWGPGQLAIWDERTTLHRGVSDHFPQRRVVRRCTVDGEAPFFDATREVDTRYLAPN